MSKIQTDIYYAVNISLAGLSKLKLDFVNRFDDNFVDFFDDFRMIFYDLLKDLIDKFEDDFFDFSKLLSK